MAKALLSSLDGVSVGEQEKEREREIECLVQRACIINEITLADGSYLGSVPQPPRFAAGSHAHIYTHTCFSSLLLSVPLTVYHSLFSLFSLCASLIQPFYPPLCARLLFIERFGRGVQAFRPKNYCHASPFHTHTHPSISLRLPHSSPFHCFLRPHQDLSTPQAKSLYSRLTTSGLQFEEELYMS